MSVKKIRTASGQERWVVRYYESGRGGPRRKRTFDREKDALFFDASIRRAKQLGQLSAEVIGSEQRFASFVDEWLEKYAVSYLRPGTLTSYAFVLDRWILPYLGRLRLRDITPETIDTWVAGMIHAGAGTPTVNRALGITQGILRRAVEWRRVISNPVAGRPRVAHVRSGEIEARTPEEVERIRRQLGRADAALVSVLAYEGLRPAEAFALEWRDVLDSDGRPRARLRVERALSDHRLAPTKTGRPREVELFKPVTAELAELYMAQGRPRRTELVFPDSEGGFLRRQNWRQRIWKEALAAVQAEAAEAGLPEPPYFRPYDLRHTAATLLIYEGRPVTEVAEHLGHADPGFTARVYAHAFKDGRGRRHIPIADAIARARRTAAQAASGG